MVDATQLQDQLVQSRVHRERDEFIASIPKHKVLALASSHRNATPCNFFDEPKRGSYNICYFLRFPDDVKWVVRIPLAPCLAFGARSKLESEIATMQLIASKTTIPIPKLIAYALGDGPDPLSSFLILEFAEGQKLNGRTFRDLPEEQLTNLYTSLADIHIQLRRLEFPSIGCLGFGPGGEIQVLKKNTSIDINVQELEGLQPSKIQASYYGPDGRLVSANKYTEMLLDIADNAFAQGRGIVLDEAQGGEALYHLHVFREFAQQWVDPSLDNGPFVLVHGDFSASNLIINEDHSIAAVLDWEWSRVVPRQFFGPPLWLNLTPTTDLALKTMYGFYLKKFHRLLEVLRTRELELFGDLLLHDEWTEAQNKSGFLVANALENWTDIDWFAYRYLSLPVVARGGQEALAARVKQFMEDPARQALIAAKVDEAQAYDAAVGELNAKDIEDAQVHTAVSSHEKAHEPPIPITDRFASYIPKFPAIAWGGIAIFVAGTSYFLGNRLIQFRLKRHG